MLRYTRTRCSRAGEQHNSKGTLRLRLTTRWGTTKSLIITTPRIITLMKKRNVFRGLVGSLSSMCLQKISEAANRIYSQEYAIVGILNRIAEHSSISLEDSSGRSWKNGKSRYAITKSFPRVLNLFLTSRGRSPNSYSELTLSFCMISDIINKFFISFYLRIRIFWWNCTVPDQNFLDE